MLRDQPQFVRRQDVKHEMLPAMSLDGLLFLILLGGMALSCAYLWAQLRARAGLVEQQQAPRIADA
jgi:hypothetical protein